MTVADLLRELEALGTAQNRKVYARHGAPEPMYGVSYANLGKLTRRIGTDHALAKALWASGNYDARILATMIADPQAMSPREMDAWARQMRNYTLADAVAGLVARSPHARRKMEQWTRSKHEWTARSGWLLLARQAMDHELDLPDAFFVERLGMIENSIHTSLNRVRDAKYLALIAIGGRNRSLRKKAEAAARRIERIEVDHGETGCKTPDAIPYIERMWARRGPKPGRTPRKSG